MPSATVPKKLLVRHASKKAGMDAQRKKLPNEKSNTASLSNKDGSNMADRTAVGTKDSQRINGSGKVREANANAGIIRGTYVTTIMPRIVKKTTFSSMIPLPCPPRHPGRLQ